MRWAYHALTFGLLACVLIVPALTLGQAPGRIVPESCTGPNCNFCDLVKLAQNILNFAIYLAVVLAAIAFAYAGGLYLTSSANPGHIQQAKTLLMNIVIGLLIILAAWLVIDTILAGLLKFDLGSLNSGCRL